MQELKPIKEGKVREIYDNGDSLIMVATDRISCFDVILNNEVTKKGAVLTQMSKFWFDMTEDILPNHMISVDTKDMPEFFQQEKFEGKSMMCRKLNMLPIECIVRGYITGSGWASYKRTALYVASGCRKALKNLTSCLNRFTHHLPRLRSEIMMRISLLSRALSILRNTSREKAVSMLRSFATTPSRSIKNAQSMHSARVSSLQIRNLSLALMRTATW